VRRIFGRAPPGCMSDMESQDPKAGDYFVSVVGEESVIPVP